MKYPLTEKAHKRLAGFHHRLGYELRARRAMRYGQTVKILEEMYDLMILRDSWERKSIEK